MMRNNIQHEDTRKAQSFPQTVMSDTTKTTDSGRSGNCNSFENYFLQLQTETPLSQSSPIPSCPQTSFLSWVESSSGLETMEAHASTNVATLSDSGSEGEGNDRMTTNCNFALFNESSPVPAPATSSSYSPRSSLTFSTAAMDLKNGANRQSLSCQNNNINFSSMSTDSNKSNNANAQGHLHAKDVGDFSSSSTSFMMMMQMILNQTNSQNSDTSNTGNIQSDSFDLEVDQQDNFDWTTMNPTPLQEPQKTQCQQQEHQNQDIRPLTMMQSQSQAPRHQQQEELQQQQQQQFWSFCNANFNDNDVTDIEANNSNNQTNTNNIDVNNNNVENTTFGLQAHQTLGNIYFGNCKTTNIAQQGYPQQQQRINLQGPSPTYINSDNSINSNNTNVPSATSGSAFDKSNFDSFFKPPPPPAVTERKIGTKNWESKLEQLRHFFLKHNHCCVPYNYKENLALARWVNRQRCQYKYLKDGKSSTLSYERVQALENIGFVWDSHRASWYERLEELKEFKKQRGHANVPSFYRDNAQLATWVKCQRRQFKLFRDNKPSSMTQERIAEMTKLGFEFEVRGGGVCHQGQHAAS